MSKREEIQAWYDDWHRKRGIHAWRGPDNYRPLVGLLGYDGEGEVLDVGCGTGWFLRAAFDCGYRTYGLDISPEAVKIANKVSPASEISVGNMEDITEIDKYDFITAFGSMEHCEDMAQAVVAIRGALKPTGTFFVMVPNSKSEQAYVSVQDEIMETRKTLTEWADFFRLHGFVVMEVGHDRGMWQPDVPLDKTYQFMFRLEVA